MSRCIECRQVMDACDAGQNLVCPACRRRGKRGERIREFYGRKPSEFDTFAPLIDISRRKKKGQEEDD